MSLLTPSFAKRALFFLCVDMILFYFSLRFAYGLRFDFDVPEEHMDNFYAVFTALTLLKTGAFYLFGIYRLTWRFFSLHDAKRLLYAHLTAAGAFFVLLWIFPQLFLPMPRSVIGIDLILSLILIGMLRMAKRAMIESTKHPKHTPTLIVGISPGTPGLIKGALEKESSYYPIGIVAVQAKNRNMIGSTVHNLRIIGTEHLRDAIESQNITAAIIDGSLPVEQLRECYRLLSDEGIEDIKRSALLSDGAETITPLSIEELLARHPKDLDTQTIESFIRGKKVLITGAGGSIGSEIALQCRRFGASELILIDNSEYNLYQIGERLPGAALHLCSVTDRAALDDILSAARPDILIHAAAYKHVPLCEANPHAAVVNNVLGSRNVIDSAIANSISKIVIISTDKAVRPTNVMGATKRVVELYAQNVDPKNSEIVSVRFGNVLGSSGSVIPKFKSQIEAGGPITITHPEITRYFMLISEACQLVLQAAAIARGGELFILDMGEPVRIQTLAETMIRLYATRPVKIAYTGLRPGEKLYEELLIDESEQKTAFESIMIARPTPCDISSLNTQIDSLIRTDDPRPLLRTIVPEYTPSGA